MSVFLPSVTTSMYFYNEAPITESAAIQNGVHLETLGNAAALKAIKRDNGAENGGSIKNGSQPADYTNANAEITSQSECAPAPSKLPHSAAAGDRG